MTASHCFFTFSCYTTDGELLDTSNIPGGYGIYRFPRHTESGVHNLTADELQTVYSLDAERVRVEALYTSKDQGQLLLVTSEDGAYMLTVIDAVTLTELQKLRLIDTDIASGWQPFRFRNLHVYEDFLVAVDDDNKFTLLTLNAEGDYEIQFEARFDSIEEIRYIFSSEWLAMDYRDEKLAVGSFQYGHYQPRNYCSFYLAVYTKTGVAYAGHYQHSLGKDMINDYDPLCLPLGEEPLRITWGD